LKQNQEDDEKTRINIYDILLVFVSTLGSGILLSQIGYYDLIPSVKKMTTPAFTNNPDF